MNAKSIFKTLLVIVMLLFLVLMGLNNRQNVDFALAPVLPHKITQTAAIMYFGFFAVGLLTGSILTAGGGKKGGSSKSAKTEK